MENVNKIICGDALEELRKLPNESISSCITSPPYFALRDYGMDGQIGQEKTYQDFLDKLLAVFDEIKRVLKKDGTCFVNLGDSYASLGKTGGDIDKDTGMDINRGRSRIKKGSYPEKSLMLIPHRFAIGMIERGWILRNTLVWIKPNAMPESVQDRWKKAHEYIFFFTKSKKYYFDLNAVRKPHKEVSLKRMVKLHPDGGIPPDYFSVNTNCSEDDGSDGHWATYPQQLISPLVLAGCPVGGTVIDPFGGSGTTGVVSKKLNRNYFLIDLNKDYCDIAQKRIDGTTPPLF